MTLSDKQSRNLSVFVVGASLLVPMGAYIDSENEARELMAELYIAQNGGSREKTSSFSGIAEYLPQNTGGRGGPAVGINAVIDGAEANTPSLEMSPDSNIEVVRVDGEGGSGMTTAENTKKVLHVKVAETVWPVEEVAISSDFGWRTAPCEGCSSDHRGVDFVPGAGTDVYSIYQGIVVAAGWYGGYGNHVEIKHYVQNDEGVIEEWRTLYAHLQSESIPENVYVGSVVQTGQKIGLVGNTGMSTGDHLHFELLIDGEHINPMPILGHYELIEMTEDELQDWAFERGIPELTFDLED